jgi:hypothetical protein
MRSVCVLGLLALLCALPLFASSRKKFSDAESDGLLGPVKSVSTTSEIVSSPPVLYHSWLNFGSVSCRVCVYDDEGRRVMRGQDWGEGFSGETTRFVSDGSGDISEQIVENEKGEIVRQTMTGPFGPTEITTYRQTGPPFRNTFHYDENGQMTETSSIDPNGTLTGNSRFRRDAGGRIIEAWNFAENNRFLSHYTDIDDPETDSRKYTEFNEDMTVRLTYNARDGEVVSYWQESRDDPNSGAAVVFDRSATQRIWEWYSPDGRFERTTVDFVDDTRRDPIHGEYYDVQGRLQVTEDNDYEFDSYKNWTKRTAWAWTLESVSRKVIEVDHRTIVYRPK